VEVARRLALEHVALPADYRRFSLATFRLLSQVAEQRRIDVVHGYEWPPAIALYFGPHLMRGVPAVCTIMAMLVAPFLPREMPLLVGTERIRRQALAAGHRRVALLEPPVDVDANAPDFDGAAFRAAHAPDPATILVVVVGRLARELKREGLLSACDAIGSLAAEGVPVQLAIVGDGPARDEVSQRAGRANAVAGRRAVTLTGAMDDPRPAYAAADVVLGMGGSALRGMAFGKPLVVQGELGYWRRCTPDTVAEFLDHGWYGLGDAGIPVDEAVLAAGAARLRAELEPLLADASLRRSLGSFGRRLVTDRFSLRGAAAVQEAFYAEAVAERRSLRLPDAARTATGVLGYRLRRRVQRWRGVCVDDDFHEISLLKASAADGRAA
jgi:glycosyltransferase involved in cell wall biosynthesis